MCAIIFLLTTTKNTYSIFIGTKINLLESVFANRLLLSYKSYAFYISDWKSYSKILWCIIYYWYVCNQIFVLIIKLSICDPDISIILPKGKMYIFNFHKWLTLLFQVWFSYNYVGVLNIAGIRNALTAKIFALISASELFIFY